MIRQQLCLSKLDWTIYIYVSMSRQLGGYVYNKTAIISQLDWTIYM